MFYSLIVLSLLKMKTQLLQRTENYTMTFFSSIASQNIDLSSFIIINFSYFVRRSIDLKNISSCVINELQFTIRLLHRLSIFQHDESTAILASHFGFPLNLPLQISRNLIPKDRPLPFLATDCCVTLTCNFLKVGVLYCVVVGT